MAKGTERRDRTPARKGVGRRPGARTATGTSSSGARRPADPRPWRGKSGVNLDELELRASAAEDATFELEISRQRYVDLYDLAPIGYTTLDPAGMIRELNLAAAALFGRKRAFLVGRPLRFLVAPPDRGKLSRYLSSCQSESGPVSTELRLVRPDGSEAIAQFTSNHIFDLNHKIRLLTSVVDLTAQKGAEAALARHLAWEHAKAAIGKAVTSGDPLDTVLTTAVAATVKALEAPVGLIHLVDPETRDLVIVSEWNVPPAYGQVAGHVKWGEDLAGHVAATARGYVVSDTAEEPGLSRLSDYTDQRLGCLSCVPLKAQGQVLGTLTLGHLRRGGLGRGDTDELQGCADMLAGAVRAERLREALRREAEARALLLRELDHRVRNNLATLIGLLHVTAERQPARTAAILHTTADRVARLADVHAVLAGQPHGWAELGLLAERVTKSVLDLAEPPGRIEWSVVAPPVRLRASKAANIALVLHELLTNCVKHAFPGRAGGTVSVEARQDGSRVGIAVCDNGRGHERGGGRAGGGLEIVRALVTHTLQGELWLAEVRGGGTLVYFRFPVNEQTQPGGPS